MARQSGDPALHRGGAERAAAPVLRHPGRSTPARASAASCWRSAQRSGQIATQALAHLVLLECAAARGEFAVADEHAAAADQLARQYDLSAPAAVYAWYSGQRLMIAGDYAGAERAYRDAARMTARAGMLEGRQDLPLITTFCLHLVDGAGRRDGRACSPRPTSAAPSGPSTPTRWRSPPPGHVRRRQGRRRRDARPCGPTSSTSWR